MPSLDLGPVVGPQGEQGATGAQGIRGEQGLPGPNQVTNSTATPLTGILTGNGSVVGVANIDAAPTADSTGFAQSGGTDKAIKARMPMYGMGKNLLDNWYFVGGGSQQGAGQFPINQRGVTTKSASQGYFIDRWREYSSYYYTVALQSGGLKLTGQSNAVSMLQQVITERLADINGKTLTLSILTDEDGLRTKTENVTLTASNANKIVVTGNNDRVLATLTGSTSSLCVVMRIPANEYMTIKAIKLELGSTQTLAHNEGTTESPVWVLNEIPDYGEELRKCQRYFLRIGKFSSSSNAMPIGSLTAAGATNAADYVVSLPTTMRYSTPSLTYSGTITIYKADGSSNVTVSNLVLNTAYCSNISLHMTATFSPTVTKGTLMGSMILSESGYVDISCDL